MPALHTCEIVDWNQERGFGFVSLSGTRIFLHIAEFKERPVFPRVGDRVRFRQGRDIQGRPCATHVELLTRRSAMGVASMFLLFLMLLLPVVAVLKLPMAPWISFPVLLVISLIAWSLYRADKRRARAGRWRVAEATLHGLELIGGWPGAFLAQRQFRHKTAKASFQFTFWSIVVLHQFLALDFLSNWRYSHEVWAFAKPVLGRLAEIAG